VKRIQIDNLGANCTQAVLRSAFAEFGQVHTATVVRDPQTGHSSCTAFVEMNSDAADAAIQGLDGKQLDGSTLRVREAGPRSRISR
jgi:RNA recognition motif-containing protein